MPGLARVHYKRLAYDRTLLAAIAAERYRIAFDRWPSSVKELVPDFVDTVPIDPYDGMPLRMRKVKDGLIIYSVGTNLIDDGGKIATPPGVIDPLDVGIQMWNPAKRRQPPGPQL